MYPRNRQISILNFSFLLFFLISVASCIPKSDFDPDTLIGPQYYPTKKGQFVVYEVRQTLHKSLAADLMTHFYRKEVLADTFTDISGKPAYRIERFRRATHTQPWQIDSVWVLRKTNNRLIKIEHNRPFIKLVFPIKHGMRWDGNALNSFAAEQYKAEMLETPFKLDSQKILPQSLRIVHRADSSLVNKNLRYEVYAKDIGMVYKKTEVLHYINDSKNPFYAKDSIVSGIFLEEVALSWGVE